MWVGSGTQSLYGTVEHRTSQNSSLVRRTTRMQRPLEADLHSDAYLLGAKLFKLDLRLTDGQYTTTCQVSCTTPPISCVRKSVRVMITPPICLHQKASVVYVGLSRIKNRSSRSRSLDPRYHGSTTGLRTSSLHHLCNSFPCNGTMQA